MRVRIKDGRVPRWVGRGAKGGGEERERRSEMGAGVEHVWKHNKFL
jgi:hypothetical protein